MGVLSSFAGARVVVTGGAGFVGSWLCERLLEEGAVVWCVDSLLTGSRDNVAHLQSEAFHLVEADVCDGIPVPRPVDPLAFQPPNGLMPGQAPVVAPARRLA